MKGFFRNSILSLVAGILMVSVIGVNIYIHHCSCEDLQYVTAIPSSTCCGHGQHEPGCCSAMASEQSCCNGPENSCPNSIHFNNISCCTTEHHFIRLDTDLDQQIKRDHLLHLAFVIDVVSPDISSESLEQDKPYQYDSSPPFTFSGRELLTLLHQRRIDC